MKNCLIIFSLLLIGLSSCEKQVEKERPEFIGYWSGGSYCEYGFIYLDISKKSKAYFYMLDYSNSRDYSSSGIARANDEKLIIGGVKYFTIIEYPHPIDTNVERKHIYNYSDGTSKIANWKMVLDGLYGSVDCYDGTRTYYMADY